MDGLCQDHSSLVELTLSHQLLNNDLWIRSRRLRYQMLAGRPCRLLTVNPRSKLHEAVRRPDMQVGMLHLAQVVDHLVARLADTSCQLRRERIPTHYSIFDLGFKNRGRFS